MSDRSFAVVGDNNLVTQVLLFNVDSEAEGITETRNFLNDQNATVVETFLNADGTAATRYNYASPGYTWDSANTAFYFHKLLLNQREIASGLHTAFLT